MTPRISVDVPAWWVDWSLMGNTMPPRDPNGDDDKDEEDEEEDEEDEEEDEEDEEEDEERNDQPPVVREPEPDEYLQPL